MDFVPVLRGGAPVESKGIVARANNLWPGMVGADGVPSSSGLVACAILVEIERTLRSTARWPKRMNGGCRTGTAARATEDYPVMFSIIRLRSSSVTSGSSPNQSFQAGGPW